MPDMKNLRQIDHYLDMNTGHLVLRERPVESRKASPMSVREHMLYSVLLLIVGAALGFTFAVASGCKIVFKNIAV